MGALGSLVFLGLVIGSATASFIFNSFSYKSIILVSLFLNAAGSILFILKKDYYIMCFARFISGFCQIFISIYAPLYFNTFSP